MWASKAKTKRKDNMFSLDDAETPESMQRSVGAAWFDEGEDEVAKWWYARGGISCSEGSCSGEESGSSVVVVVEQ